MYTIKEGNYHPTFLKAIAAAIHMDKLEPAELEYWQDNGYSQKEIAEELYKRITSD